MNERQTHSSQMQEEQPFETQPEEQTTPHEESQTDEQIEERTAETADAPPTEDAAAQEGDGFEAQEERKVDEMTLQSIMEERDRFAQERDDYLDALQRLQAEFDNFRKRTARERAAEKDRMIEDVLSRLLDVADNMERALNVDASHENIDSYRTGVQMIQQQLMTVLSDFGVTRIDSVGVPFDPNFHEAIGQVESTDYEPGYIVNEIAPGYMVSERILRAPKVQVAIAPKGNENESEAETNQEESQSEA